MQSPAVTCSSNWRSNHEPPSSLRSLPAEGAVGRPRGGPAEADMTDKAILTCALTGVLTNPQQHPVPVTPAQMAAEARDAFNAGASIMHVHLREQEPGFGHMPSWDPDVAEAVVGAIREACPGVVINLTTGIVGKDTSGPIACLRRVRPEAAACNAGSLNYLKIKDNGEWAWP